MVSQYSATSVNVTPQSPGTTSASFSSTPPLRPPEPPPPSRRLRSGIELLISLSVPGIYTLCSGLAKAHQGGSPLANSWANAMARYSEHHSLVSDLRAAEQAVTRRTECHHHTRRTEHCTSTQQIAPSGAIATMQFIGRINGNQRDCTHAKRPVPHQTRIQHLG